MSDEVSSNLSDKLNQTKKKLNLLSKKLQQQQNLWLNQPITQLNPQ